jgi:hypothetical protein
VSISLQPRGAAERMQSPKWRRYRLAWHKTLGPP